MGIYYRISEGKSLQVQFSGFQVFIFDPNLFSDVLFFISLGI